MAVEIETGLRGVAASEAMRPGALTCPPETPLRDVARMMARFHIHAVIVLTEPSDEDVSVGLWGVVSDSDLIAAAAVNDIDGRTAGGTARTPVIAIYPHESVQRAVELMKEHRVTHLVVVSPESERPVGVLSTLDVARAIASEPAFVP